MADAAIALPFAAISMARSAIASVSHWKQRKTNPLQRNGGKNAISAIKIRAFSPKQHLLSQVCLKFLVLGPTQKVSGDFSDRRSFSAIGIRSLRAAAFALSLSTLGGVSHAQEWSPVSSSTDWRPRSSFVENMTAPVTSRAVVLSGSRQLDQLFSIIALAEANNGYDSVQHGARVKPPALPTQMTVAQIYQWIDATPGQPPAIGRYQFIPATLRDLIGRLGVSSSARFDRALQDRLASALVAQAGYQDFHRGDLSASRFLDNLAQIWAGLP